MNQPGFVHLRLHTEFSLVDGIVRIKPLIKRLLELKMPAIAITDQTNLFALVKFYRAALAAGIKPIAGADVWVFNDQEPANPFRMTLLVRNYQGYIALTELLSQAFQQGQHQGVPMLQKEWLIENHQGLIALSGAMEGEIGQAILAGKLDDAELIAEQWKTVFGDAFYLELQRLGKPEENTYIQQALDLSAKQGIPAVATNDVRFIDTEQFGSHEVRVCIHQGRVLDDSRRPKDYMASQYLRSIDEMQALFSDIPEALQNTVQIAKRCNLELTFGENYLPDFPVPEGMTLDQHFCEVSRQGL